MLARLAGIDGAAQTPDGSSHEYRDSIAPQPADRRRPSAGRVVNPAPAGGTAAALRHGTHARLRAGARADLRSSAPLVSSARRGSSEAHPPLSPKRRPARAAQLPLWQRLLVLRVRDRRADRALFLFLHRFVKFLELLLFARQVFGE